MAHTPGPWVVGPIDDTAVTHLGKDGIRYEVAAVDGDYNDPDEWPIMEANARLIAAAPDLLAVARDATHFLNGMVEIARMIGLTGTSDWDKLFGTNDGFGLIDKIDAAIAKAEGAHVAALEAKERT